MSAASGSRARRALIFAAAAFVSLATVNVSTADGKYSKVLGSVQVEPGQHADDATTVNGSVDIGANAVVRHAGTVNGSITLRANSTAASVKTVNGSARLQAGVHVAGNVELVNGSITLDKAADVSGRVSNVNGSIQLEAAHVGDGIETTNADIDIGANSRVEGGILMNENHESWFSFGMPKLPTVVIGPGAIVKGTLRFHREVKLYVSDRASIGAVDGATAIKFSGDRP